MEFSQWISSKQDFEQNMRECVSGIWQQRMKMFFSRACCVRKDWVSFFLDLDLDLGVLVVLVFSFSFFFSFVFSFFFCFLNR